MQWGWLLGDTEPALSIVGYMAGITGMNRFLSRARTEWRTTPGAIHSFVRFVGCRGVSHTIDAYMLVPAFWKLACRPGVVVPCITDLCGSRARTRVWFGLVGRGRGGEVLADAFVRAQSQSVDSCDRRLP